MMNRPSSADLAAREFVITREFAAPRDLVWRAWTEPEQLMRWWGPKDFTAPSARIDLRVGGTYLNCMRGPDGQDYWSTGRYLEIVAPERIAATDSFADPAGRVVPASYYGMEGDWPLELRIELKFEEVGGKTRLTLHHSGWPTARDREGAMQGWNESFDKLADMLEGATKERRGGKSKP